MLMSKNFKNPGTVHAVNSRVARRTRHDNMNQQHSLRRAQIVDEAKWKNTYDGKSLALKHLALMDLYQHGLLFA